MMNNSVVRARRGTPGFHGRFTMQPDRDHEGGFTVVEVVFASAILFMVMTTLVGLLEVTTRMSVQSKERAAITNAVASEADRLRAMPFSALSGTAGTPLTETLSGFTMLIRDTVSDRTDVNQANYNGTKEVTVQITASRTGYPTTTFTTMVVVRDKSGLINPPIINGPNITFGLQSPPVGAVCWSNLYGLTQSAPLVVDAMYSSSNADITKVEFYVDGNSGQILLQDSNLPGANQASKTYPTPVQADSFSFSWDTRQVDGHGLPQVSDGLRTVTLKLYTSSLGQPITVSRQVLIDNYPPDSIPTTGTASTLTRSADAFGNASQTVAFRWPQTLDAGVNGYPAYEYNLGCFEDTNGNADYTKWSQVSSVSSTTLNTNSDSFTADPFSIFRWYVGGVSPRGLAATLTAGAGIPATSTTIFTRPVLPSVYAWSPAKNGGQLDMTGTISPPTYPYSYLKVEILLVSTNTDPPTSSASFGPAPISTNKWETWTQLMSSSSTYSNPGTPWTTQYYDDIFQVIKHLSVTYAGIQTRMTITPTPSGMATQTVLYSPVSYVKVPKSSVATATGNLTQIW